MNIPEIIEKIVSPVGEKENVEEKPVEEEKGFLPSFLKDRNIE